MTMPLYIRFTVLGRGSDLGPRSYNIGVFYENMIELEKYVFNVDILRYLQINRYKEAENAFGTKVLCLLFQLGNDQVGKAE